MDTSLTTGCVTMDILKSFFCAADVPADVGFVIALASPRSGDDAWDGGESAVLFSILSLSDGSIAVAFRPSDEILS